jgi:hypothetical protein
MEDAAVKFMECGGGRWWLRAVAAQIRKDSLFLLWFLGHWGVLSAGVWLLFGGDAWTAVIMWASILILCLLIVDNQVDKVPCLEVGYSIDANGFGAATPSRGWIVRWSGVTGIDAGEKVVTIRSASVGPFRIRRKVLGDQLFGDAKAIAEKRWRESSSRAVEAGQEEEQRAGGLRFVQGVPKGSVWRQAWTSFLQDRRFRRITLLFAVPAWLEASVMMWHGGWMIVGAVAFGLWFTLMWYFFLVLYGCKGWRSLKGNAPVVEVTEDGIYFTTGAMTSWVKWEGVSSVTEEPTHFLVECSDLSFLGLYTGGLRADEMERLRGLFAEAAGRHANITVKVGSR